MFLKTAAAGRGRTCAGRCRRAPRRPGETLYNGIRLAHPWPPRRHGFQAQPITPPYLAIRPRHSDRRRPPAVRRRFPDRRDLADAHVPSRRVPSRQSGPAPRRAWEKYDEYAERTQDALEPGGDGVQRRRLVRPAGPPVQDVVHGRLLAEHLLRRLARRHQLGAARARRRRRHQHRHARHRDSSHRLARPGRARPGAPLQDGALARSRSACCYVSRGRHPLDAKPAAAARRRPHDGLLQPVPQGLGLQPPRRAIGRLRAAYRRYWETRDFVAAHAGQRGRAGAVDRRGRRATTRRPEYNVPAELYNLDCVAYESLLLGLFTIWRGERQRPREAERRLRRLQPRRLSLGPPGPRARSCRCRSTSATGTGPTCSRPAAAAWSSATSCTSTSAAGGACPAPALRASAAPAWPRCGATASRRWIAPRPRRGVERLDAAGARHADDAAGALLRAAPVRQRRRRRRRACAWRCSTAKAAVARRSPPRAACRSRGRHDARARSTGRAARSVGAGRQTVRFRFQLTRGRLYAFWVSPSATAPAAATSAPADRLSRHDQTT